MSSMPDPPQFRLASIDRSQSLLHTVDVERLILIKEAKVEYAKLQ